jgi:hypothetical protein
VPKTSARARCATRSATAAKRKHVADLIEWDPSCARRAVRSSGGAARRVIRRSGSLLHHGRRTCPADDRRLRRGLVPVRATRRRERRRGLPSLPERRLETQPTNECFEELDLDHRRQNWPTGRARRTGRPAGLAAPPRPSCRSP